MLCYKTVQNAQKACGEYDSLTQEVSSLHAMFKQLEKEKNNPESVLNKPDNSCREDLEAFLSGCKKDLVLLEKLLEKYNALGAESGGFKKLRHKVRFGNGKMADLPVLRAKISYYNSILHTQLQLVSIQSANRVERTLQDAGGELGEIRKAVEKLNLQLVKGNDSPLTPFLDDDVAVWKTFRRELLNAGYSSSMLHKHGDRIRSYCQRLVTDEKLARASPTGSMAFLAPNTADSFSTNFYTPEESFRDAMTSMEPPTARTVEPESTLEDAVIGSQSGLFKLPPPALPIDEDSDSLAVTGLEPGTDISVLRTESSYCVSRKEPSGFTPSDALFSSLFSDRHIPGGIKETEAASFGCRVEPTKTLATELGPHSDVPSSSMFQRIWQRGIAT